MHLRFAVFKALSPSASASTHNTCGLEYTLKSLSKNKENMALNSNNVYRRIEEISQIHLDNLVKKHLCTIVIIIFDHKQTEPTEQTSGDSSLG